MRTEPQAPVWISRLYLSLFALLPWSIEFDFGSWKMILPSEAMIAMTGIGLGWYILRYPEAIRGVIRGNAILLLSALWIGWLGISACFSSIPVVSWKYWVVEAGHWWVFAVGLSLFPALWLPAFRWFAWSMAGMVIYTLIHHAFYHFRADQALLAPMPFFPENTLYAAVLSMVLMALFNRTTEISRSVHETDTAFLFPVVRVRLISVVLLTGLFFAFCRAAWLSVLVAFTVGSLLVFRKKWKWFALAGLSLLASGFIFRGQIRSGINNDVSTLERLNRYRCAIRMVRDHPWTGFGPGTFQFQYLPYQRPEEMTRISMKEPVWERSPNTYGRGGGAHSEYFQALAEMGWPGFFLWTGMTLMVLWAGFKQHFLEKTKENQWFALALTLSLLTFFLHGLVNNLLHDGRIAALVWSMIGVCSSRRQ